MRSKHRVSPTTGPALTYGILMRRIEERIGNSINSLKVYTNLRSWARATALSTLPNNIALRADLSGYYVLPLPPGATVEQGISVEADDLVSLSDIGITFRTTNPALPNPNSDPNLNSNPNYCLLVRDILAPADYISPDA